MTHKLKLFEVLSNFYASREPETKKLENMYSRLNVTRYIDGSFSPSCIHCWAKIFLGRFIHQFS